MRASAVGVLQEDFIKTARTKGISDRAILNRHVKPNALIPTVTFLGLQLGALISGAIVTEVIFALPGMGRLGLNAILSRDYPVVLGVVLVVAFGYVLVNLLVDLSYGLIDPRVRTQMSDRSADVTALPPSGVSVGEAAGLPPKGRRLRLASYLALRDPLACVLVAVFVLAATHRAVASRRIPRMSRISMRHCRGRRRRTSWEPTSSGATSSAACSPPRGWPPRRC